MDAGQALYNLWHGLAGLMVAVGGFFLTLGLGWKALVVIAHGGNERAVRQELPSMLIMGVAFAFLTAMASTVGPEWLPGPARVLAGVGNVVWQAINSALTSGTGVGG